VSAPACQCNGWTEGLVTGRCKCAPAEDDYHPPIYFFDGEIGRRIVWQERDPDGLFEGHYYVEQERGTYGDALQLVTEALGMKNDLLAVIDRYAKALAEIARPHPGPTHEEAAKHRQHVARAALKPIPQ
jgi:hypothetical protein